ncbi:flagella synthesis protein FlgN [Pseudohongiella sp.]|uniref:FlgN family protein n=1 Tax=marine sediment metagenome TaxID=412755 RepID=A0A0F9W2X2_9ZZZZ|nr:flagellar protein FlgN [Pseudohongiella sp.]HDZ09161.1 flagellar protein FlgN [Pseudohongiella sp.]HEA63503.1 flagellar protein FlgN [Pseudohongiella sp.]
MSNEGLQQLLDSDRQLLDSLAEVLLAEKNSLEKRDLDQLSDLLTRKQNVLASIENNDHIRRKLLVQAGVPAGQTNLQHLKRLLGKGGQNEFTALLDSIESRLQQCRELSETNSIIVHRSRLNTQRALGILRGPSTLAGLYTSHGSTLGGSEQRDLGSA